MQRHGLEGGRIASGSRVLAAAPDSTAALVQAMNDWLRAGDPRAALTAAQSHRVAREQTASSTLEPLLRQIAADDESIASAALLLLARHQVRWSQLNAAQLTLAELWDRDLDDESRVHVALLRARACLRQGAPDRAIFVLEDATGERDADVRLRLMAGEIFVWSGRFVEGRDLLASLSLPATEALAGRRAASMAVSFVLEQDGGNARRWTEKARLAYRADAPAAVAALEIIARVLTEELDCAWSATLALEREPTASAFGRGLRDSLKAFVLWRRGHLRESIEVGEAALRLLDDEVDRLVGPLLANALARAHLGLGRLGRAEALLRHAEGATSASGLAALGASCAVTRLLLAATCDDWSGARERARFAAELCRNSSLVAVEGRWADRSLELPSRAEDAADALAGLRTAQLGVYERRYPLAVDGANLAAGWYGKVGADYDHALALCLRGEAELQLGMVEQARRTLANCAVLCQRHGYHALETSVLLLHAVCDEREGNLVGFISSLRRLPEIAGADGFCQELWCGLKSVGLSGYGLPSIERGPTSALARRLQLARPRIAILGTRRGVWLVDREPSIDDGDVLVRSDRCELQHAGKRVAVSPQVTDILVELADGSGRTAEELYLRVWRADTYHPLRHRNAVYTAIRRLRQLLLLLTGRDLLINRSNAQYAIAPDIRLGALCALDGDGWPVTRWRTALKG